MSKSIVIVGTLDTKSEEILFAKEQIELRGHKAIVMDMSVGSKPSAKGISQVKRWQEKVEAT